MKKIIGLTGKTGSGKSCAAEFFRKKGACVADCDKIAHSVLEASEVKDKLRETFSNCIFDEKGNVIRKELAKIVFSDKEKLEMLNGIVHPVITEKVLGLISESEAELGVIDGSELGVSGIDKKCDKIIVITADEAVRLKRITERDKIDEQSAQMRIRAQKDYNGEAVIVENNAGIDELEAVLEVIYKEIMED